MSGPYKHSHYTSTQDDQRTISRPVRRHLIHVYLALAAMCAVATAGSATGDALLGSAGTTVGSLGAVASVSMFRFTPMHSRSRWGLLFVYALSSGIALTTLLSIFFNWDPSGNLVFMALSSAVMIFLGFSASAVMAERRSMIYVGGLAASAIGILFWLSIANVFLFRSQGLFSLELYAGLLAFSGFVVYDTQMIVERASQGILDVPGHAMELFMDLYSLFIRLANIFLKKEQDRERRDKRRRVNRLERDL